MVTEGRSQINNIQTNFNLMGDLNVINNDDRIKSLGLWMKYMERLFGNIYQVVENPNEESLV